MYEYRNRTRSLFNNPTNSGPSVYGSRTPGKFLSDLAAGTDSLDIICIGDSNNGSSLTGSWGYVGGMSEALNNRGYPIYGTPVYPVADKGYSAGLGLGTWKGSHIVSPTGGSGQLGSTASTGGYAAAAPYSVWNHGTNLTSYGGTVPTYSDDWLFVPATVTDASSFYVVSGASVDYDHPLSANGTTVFLRVRYGKFNTSGGKFYLYATDQSSANPNVLIASPTQVSSYTGGGGTVPTFDMTEASFTANGKGISAAWGGYNYPTGTLFVTGPSAIFCQSLYRKSKGWAVHSRGYYSGGTSTQIAAMQSNTASTALQLYLREIRERQIAAGGTGRVLLFVHSGINDTSGATAWTAAHTSIWSTYQTAWAALGYPSSDLAMVSMVGVQQNSADTSGGAVSLPAVRTAATQMVAGNPSMCVVDVKSLLPYNALVAGDGSGASYYQRYNNVPTTGSDITVHLSGGAAEAITGTATGVSATSLTLASGSPNVNGYFNNSTLSITGGTTGAYQKVRITSYAGSTGVATVAGWIGATPSGTITYSISRQCPSDGYAAVSNLVINQLLASKPVN